MLALQKNTALAFIYTVNSHLTNIQYIDIFTYRHMLGTDLQSIFHRLQWNSRFSTMTQFFWEGKYKTPI